MIGRHGDVPDVMEAVLFVLAIVALIALFMGMRYVSTWARTIKTGRTCPSCGRRLEGSFIVSPYCAEPLEVKDR